MVGFFFGSSAGGCWRCCRCTCWTDVDDGARAPDVADDMADNIFPNWLIDTPAMLWTGISLESRGASWI